MLSANRFLIRVTEQTFGTWVGVAWRVTWSGFWFAGEKI
jgi:hypothetical protein